jgi:hypothetical protein
VRLNGLVVAQAGGLPSKALEMVKNYLWTVMGSSHPVPYFSRNHQHCPGQHQRYEGMVNRNQENPKRRLNASPPPRPPPKRHPPRVSAHPSRCEPTHFARPFNGDDPLFKDGSVPFVIIRSLFAVCDFWANVNIAIEYQPRITRFLTQRTFVATGNGVYSNKKELVHSLW